MKVEWRYAGPHPITENWIGCVIVDDNVAFDEWLGIMMPNHRIRSFYQLYSGSAGFRRGYRYRFNIKCDVPSEQMIFKLTWQNSPNLEGRAKYVV